MQDFVSENIRFVLYFNGTPRANWLREVREWTGCSPERAEALLTGAVPSDKELLLLSAGTGRTGEELLGRLLEQGGVDILHENLRHLVESLAHGERKQFAAKVGVHATTVSRWRSGVQRPTELVQRAICRYFGISDGTDLRRQPLFLEFAPRSDQARRDWLHERVRGLPANVLTELFPALERLLRA